MMNNLLKRSIFGILFVAIIVASLTVVPYMAPALAIIAQYLMLKEFFGISIGDSYRTEQKLFIFSSFLLFSVFFFHFSEYCLPLKWTAVAVLPMMAALIIIIFREYNSAEFHKVPFLFAGILYIGLPVALLPKILFDNGTFNGMLLLSFFIIIWTSDVGAYLVGSTLGQRDGARKLAPKISPKKSWWGVIGSIVLGTGSAILINRIGWIPGNLIQTCGLGILMTASGICGDLFESVWKRYFHVKDSGNAIPGHGGMLDRFDSSLFAIPFATIYLTLINIL